MRKITLLIFAAFFLSSSFCFAAKQTVWNLSNHCPEPESAYYDKETDTIYVSCQVGPGDLKDGKGWLVKISTDGKLVSEKWIDGLNAPKGIASSGDRLWVTDIDRVVKIDKKNGKILKFINIKEAKFLNDVTIDPKGAVYVSDTIGNAIYQIVDDKPAVFMSGDELESPNGLYFNNNNIYVAPWGPGLAKDWSTNEPGRLYSIDIDSKKISYVTKRPLGNLDGLEIDRDGKFIVSDWMAGKIYTVSKKGKAELIYQGTKGLADIGYIPNLHYILVPEMFEGSISAIK